jgi:Lar family restriction alleviation protein
MNELKPCPFCGGEASATGVIRYDAKHQAWFSDGARVLQAFFCSCLSCGIDNKGLLGHQTQEKAIAAWNRRADDSGVSIPRASEQHAEALRGLRSLKVLLGTDSPEVRGWAPAVQQAAQRAVNAAIRALAAGVPPSDGGER